MPTSVVLFHKSSCHDFIVWMLLWGSVPTLGVQHQATVRDQPRHLALKAGRDDVVSLSTDDQGGTANVGQDRSIVKRREAVEQV